MTVPIGQHELRERLVVRRRVATQDEWGGTAYTYQQVGEVRAKVSQPTAAEQVEAQQAGSSMTMIVHLLPGADVRRGDHLLRADGETLRVKYTRHPSEPVYLRADVEAIQSEGEQA